MERYAVKTLGFRKHAVVWLGTGRIVSTHSKHEHAVLIANKLQSEYVPARLATRQANDQRARDLGLNR